jgi:hypothetical protein
VGALVDTVMDLIGFRCHEYNAKIKIELFMFFIKAPLLEGTWSGGIYPHIR